MIKLLEKEVYIKVRKEDLQMTQGLIKDCEKEYEEIMLRETNEEYKTKLIVSHDEFLLAEDGGECGGVMLLTGNRKIVCSNTLMARLDLCFEELLPQIRAQLFPGTGS